MKKVIAELPLIVLLIFLAYTFYDGPKTVNAADPTNKETTMPAQFTVKSSNFHNGERLHKEYTCEGADVSPQLSWNLTPNGTQSFAVICDDPDAPKATPWVHWVLFNLPPSVTELHEGIMRDEMLPNGALQGKNDFGKIGYNGACPPEGHGTHRYFFKVYALDIALDLEAGVSKADVEKAMDGHVLAQSEIIGTYSRE